jgi:5-methylcytosine-specific restriction endonuclease McrA
VVERSGGGVSTKVCTKCQVEQSIDQFTNDKSRADGLFPQCRMCRKADRHVYYLDHKEEIFDKSKGWHAANPNASRAIKKRYRDTHKEEIKESIQIKRQSDPEYFREKHRRTYTRNRDKILQKFAEWRVINRERLRQKARNRYQENIEVAREKSRKLYQTRKDKHAIAVKRWGQNNPDSLLAIVHRRRAKRYQNGGSYTVQEWKELKSHYNHTCLCCGKQEPEIKLTVDHVIPIARGGTDNIDNIQPLCRKCNASKNVKSTDYRNKEYIND